MRGRPLQVLAHAAPRFDGAQVAARARSRLGEDRYRFWSNNCEHFVSWCIDDTGRSAQVDAVRARLQRISAAWRAPLAIGGLPAGHAAQPLQGP